MNYIEPVKCCSKCGLSFALDQFVPKCNICKACRYESVRLWRRQNPNYHKYYNARSKAVET